MDVRLPRAMFGSQGEFVLGPRTLATVLIVAAALPLQAQTEPEEHAVYRAVLSTFIVPDTRRLVLSDSTRPSQIPLSGFASGPSSIVELLRQELGPIPDELLEDFNRQNASRVAFPESMGLSVPVELLSESQERSLRIGVDTDQWNWVRLRLPGSPGIVALTRPGFSPERDLALVSVRLDCGSRCGFISFVLLRNVDEQWHVQGSSVVMRS